MNNGTGGSRAAKKRKKKQESTTKKSTSECTLPGDSGVSGERNGDNSSNITTNKGSLNQAKMQRKRSLSDMVSIAAEQLKVEVADRSILEILALDDPKEVTSAEKAALLLSSLIEDGNECSFSAFYTDFWGKKPRHTRKAKGYLRGLVTKKALLKLLDNQSLTLGQDLAVIHHKEGKTYQSYPLRGGQGASDDNIREVDTGEVLRVYKEAAGHLRFLSPQTHIDMLSRLLAALEIHFNSRVGCHCEVIPHDSREWGGLSLDSADSFIVQMAGSTMWRVHAPKEGEALKCSVSSFAACAAINEEEETNWSQSAKAFADSSLEEQRYLDITMQAGDTLYIPKGWGFTYCRATASPGLHKDGKPGKSKDAHNKDGDEGACFFMRMATNEGTAYRDLLEQVMPAALQVCFEEVPSFREPLPCAFSSCLGAVHSEDDNNPQRRSLQDVTSSMLQRVGQVASSLLDSGADQLVKRFLGQRQPILLTEEEESRSASGFADARIMSYTRLRMLRPGIARCVVEDDVCVLYHCMDNSRELYGAQLNPLEFDIDDGVCIEGLLAAYPQAVMVADLPHPSEEDEDKVGVAQALYKEGLLVIDDDAVTQGAAVTEGGSDEEESGDSDDPGDPF